MFNRHKVSVWEDEKGSGDGGGDGCITVWMYLILLSCILKMGKMGNFMLCVFYHIKK